VVVLTLADDRWERGSVPLKFQFSDIVFARAYLSLFRRSARLDERPLDLGEVPEPPPRVDGLDGYVVWSHPIARRLPVLSPRRDMLLYTPRQYRRFSVNFGGDFRQYLTSLSANTRSSIKRKLRQFSAASEGIIDWKVYRSPEEISAFFPLARKVSARSYQERLLRIGLPDDKAFIASALALARRDEVRAYLLFLKGQPISYLYCPIRQGAVIYDHLGYDPSYARLSPGTVLQILVLESLFAEGRFSTFDFTEGEGQHKEIFSTGNCLCGDVYVIYRRLAPVSVVMLHHVVDRTSAAAGLILDQLKVKSRLRRLLRSI
jgi:hypothetical protein